MDCDFFFFFWIGLWIVNIKKHVTRISIIMPLTTCCFMFVCNKYDLGILTCCSIEKKNEEYM